MPRATRDDYPRVNVVGVRDAGESDRPLVHVNGHLDVVPVGEGWTESTPLAASSKTASSTAAAAPT